MKSKVQQTLGADLIFFNSSMKIEYERGEKKEKVICVTSAAIVLHTLLIRERDTEMIWKQPCNHDFGHRTAPHALSEDC